MAFNTLHEGTLEAGQSTRIGHGNHGQFFIMECDGLFLDVVLHGFKNKPNEKASARMYKGVPADVNFENAVITNPHATAVSYKIYTPPVGMKFMEGRNVEAGPTSILGTVGVTGQPLTDDGGSITPVGRYSKYSNLTTPDGTVADDEVLAAVDNVNGAIIRFCSITVVSQTATGGHGYLTNGTDLGGTNNKIIDLRNIGQAMLQRDVYIPAGDSLEFHAFYASIRCSINYDLL